MNDPQHKILFYFSCSNKLLIIPNLLTDVLFWWVWRLSPEPKAKIAITRVNICKQKSRLFYSCVRFLITLGGEEICLINKVVWINFVQVDCSTIIIWCRATRMRPYSNKSWYTEYTVNYNTKRRKMDKLTYFKLNFLLENFQSFLLFWCESFYVIETFTFL